MSNQNEHQSKLQEQLAAKKLAESQAIAEAAAKKQAEEEASRASAAATAKTASAKVPSYKIIKANRIANAAGYLLKPSNTGFYTPKDQEEFELLEYFCTTGHLEKV